MSLVSDALKKAEQMRLEQAGVLAPRQRPTVAARSLHTGRFGPSSAKWWWANAAVLGVALVMAVLYLRRPVAEGAAASGATASEAAVATPPVVKANATSEPATPAEVVAPEPVPVADAPSAPVYELCGVTVSGKDTLVGVTRKGDGRSAWISVGQTLGNVTVVSYDAQREQATLRVDGQLVTAAMRTGAW